MRVDLFLRISDVSYYHIIKKAIIYHDWIQYNS